MIQIDDQGWDWRARMAERLDVAARAGGVGIWEWRILASDLVWDERMFELHGLASAPKVELADFLRLVDPRHRARVAAELEAAAAGLAAFDTDFLLAGGRWIRAKAELLRDRYGHATRLLGAAWDVTDDQRLADELHEGREQFELTLASISDTVVTTDAQGRVAFMNGAGGALTGHGLDAWRGRLLAEVLEMETAEGQEPLGAMIGACLAGSRPPPRQARRIAGAAGRPLDVEATVSAIRTRQGEVVGVLMVLRDITEALGRERELLHAAAHDSLTGLANRKALEEALAACAVQGGHVLCCLDIDRFKVINDSAGHGAGDMFLRQIAGVFQQIVKPGDLFARIGGDEFAIILRDDTLESAEAVGEALVRAAADFRFLWQGRIYPSGVSIGLAEIRPGAAPADLLGQADAACYAAKSWGRGRVSVYRPDDSAVARWYEEINAVAGLREVLAEGRLVLYAQEIAPAAGGGEGRHFELLIRLRARDGTVVSPDVFIPAAERFDLMGEIDRWVMEEALERLGPRIAAIPRLRLSINLSGNTLNDTKALAHLWTVLDRSMAPASALTFEVTETAALNSLVTAGKAMERLRARGCRIALDDFGTGLSSFSYLKSFAVDDVKIDGSFIKGIAHSEVDRAIVESMNALAHRLGARTVAEYVHDEATADIVRAIGVDCIQGYALHAPEPLTDVLERLEMERGEILLHDEVKLKKCR